MSKRDAIVPLRHMISHAGEAVELLRDQSLDGLAVNRVLSLAIVRLLEVIGEAANRIPREVQADYPQIPWPQLISFRNRLIHGYDSVDLDIVWVTVTQDLPPLIDSLNAILAEQEASSPDAPRS